MIELADKWTRQPQRPTGVSAEWRQRGLVALFDTRAGIELIHNNRASNLSTTRSPSAGGMAADFSGTANQQYAHRDAYSTTGAMTLVFVMDVDTLSNYGALIAKQGTTTSNGPYEVRLGTGSTDSRISMLRASSANYGISNASGSDLISAGEKIVRLVIRFTEADEVPIGHAFVNGAKLSFGGPPVGRPPTDNMLATVWIGRRYDGVTQMDGRIYYVALFNRAISDAEALALTQNPWQLYVKRPKRLFAAPAVTVYRPGSDISVSGWTPSTGSDLFDCIDETTASDADYIISPDLSTSATFGFTTSVPAGNWDVNFRARRIGDGASIRIVMLDSGGSSVGASGWQAQSGSFIDYVASVTTTGTADRFRIEVQP